MSPPAYSVELADESTSPCWKENAAQVILKVLVAFFTISRSTMRFARGDPRSFSARGYGVHLLAP